MSRPERRAHRCLPTRIEPIPRALREAGFVFFTVSRASDWHVVTFDFEACVDERRALAADVLAEYGYDVAPAGLGTLIVGQPGRARVERLGLREQYVTAEPIAA